MSRKLLILTLVVTSFFISSMVFAGKVYKIINPDGSVTYTDTPPAEHEKTETLSLPPVNAQQPVKPQVKADPESTEEALFDGYKELVIISPADNDTIPPGQETVTIKTKISPPLQPEHLFQVYYDGTPIEKPTTALTHTITSLFRGSHIIQVTVIGPDGQALIKSSPLTIHVKRGIKRQAKPSQTQN